VCAQLAIEYTAVNTGDEPVLREAWIAFFTVAAAEVTALSAPIEWKGGLDMAVPPFSTQVVQAGGAACSPPEAREIMNLRAATGSHTERLSVYVDRPGDAGGKQLVYENYDWHEPVDLRFDSVTVNPPPEASSKVGGGMSGTLRVEPGDVISWECEVHNSGDLTLSYALAPYTAERCDLVGTFISTSGEPWLCETR